jgi:hypothetical protein
MLLFSLTISRWSQALAGYLTAMKIDAQSDAFEVLS